MPRVFKPVNAKIAVMLSLFAGTLLSSIIFTTRASGSQAPTPTPPAMSDVTNGQANQVVVTQQPPAIFDPDRFYISVGLACATLVSVAGGAYFFARDRKGFETAIDILKEQNAALAEQMNALSAKIEESTANITQRIEDNNGKHATELAETHSRISKTNERLAGLEGRLQGR